MIHRRIRDSRLTESKVKAFDRSAAKLIRQYNETVDDFDRLGIEPYEYAQIRGDMEAVCKKLDRDFNELGKIIHDLYREVGVEF